MPRPRAPFLRQTPGDNPLEDQRRRELAGDLGPLLSCPLLAGVLITGQPTIVGEVKVRHGLGRVPQGFLVTKSVGAPSSLYWLTADDQTLTLQSAAVGVVDLWVFG